MANHVKTYANNTVQTYPYNLSNVPSDIPGVTLPNNFSRRVQFLKENNIHNVQPTAKPTVNFTQVVTEGEPELVGTTWVQTWVTSNASPEIMAQQVAAFKAMVAKKVNGRLNNFAATKGYDNIISVTTYENDPNEEFAADAETAKTLRSETWTKLYEILAEVESGQRAIPTSFEDIEGELPTLTWD